MTRYRLTGTVEITARSTLHDVHAHAPGLTGWLDAVVRDEIPEVAAARLELPAGAVSGDNALITREITKRLEPGHHPLVCADVTRVGAAAGGRYPVHGELELHGVRRPVEGSAIMRSRRGGALRIDGRVLLDIRRFGLRAPGMLGMRIRPEVDVRLEILATPASDPGLSHPPRLEP